MANPIVRDTAEFHFLPIDRYPVSAGFLSDRGPVRPNNEDSAAVTIPADKAVLQRKGILVMVADGMGGREGGETASGLAARHVPSAYYLHNGTADESLLAAFRQANRAILDEAERNKRLAGMGTTCSAVAVVNGLAFAAHVGDSRIYLVRGGGAYRMTEDHSAPMQLVNRGIITLAEAAHHEDRNVILRAMGTRPDLEVARWREPFPLQPGDRLVLCSDGLHETVSDGEIAQLAAGSPDPQTACASLIELATRRECGDNVTAAVISMGRAISE